MPEPWDEVVTAEKEQKLCMEDVQNIKSACAKDHGKSHVVECEACWTKVVNRLRDRYLCSAAKEWFSGRRMFLQDLDSLFAQAREQKIDHKDIEQRIAQEKNDWYRDKTKSLDLHQATKTKEEERRLRDKLNDRTILANQLASDLRQMFSDSPEHNEAAFQSYLNRLKSASTPEVRSELQIETFFRPSQDPDGAAKLKKYIDALRGGKPVGEVINCMIRDRQSTTGQQSERRHLQAKLDESRRAKVAHELEKTRKAKTRQDSMDATAVEDGNHRMPPCAECGKDVDPQSMVVCPHCHVLAEVYHVQHETTVFCSDDCADRRLVRLLDLCTY
jgi:hypothetical protein